MGLLNTTLRACSLMQRYWNRIKIAVVGSKGTILVFHEVDTENKNNVEPSSFCSVELFKKILEEHKGEFCNMDDFLSDSVSGKIVVTFDDVPESVYLNAYPILCELQIPFVLYFSPKFIGCRGFMSVDQIREVSKNPLCTIGAHTMKHTKLRLEADSYKDMRDSMIEVEKVIGKHVEHLAYPYGRADSISNKVRKEAKRAGFKSATCTIPTKVPKVYNKWYIPRIAIW